MLRPLLRLVAALSGALAFLPAAAPAEDGALQLTIKDHRFTPEELEVPANQKVKLRVRNLDPTAEEFESFELNREKVVAGNAEIILFIGPLAPGRYPYFGDFHRDTATGAIVAK